MHAIGENGNEYARLSFVEASSKFMSLQSNPLHPNNNSLTTTRLVTVYGGLSRSAKDSKEQQGKY